MTCVVLLALLLVCFTASGFARNAVVGVAFNYAPNVMRPFVKSLREAGYTGEVLLAVYASQLDSLSDLAHTYDIRFIPIAKTALRSSVYVARFELYLQWSFFLAEDDIMLTADVRDTFFQADPFARRFTDNLADLNLFGEPKAIGECPYNRNWISSCWGQVVIDRIGDRNIICSGSIMGRVHAVRRLLRDMLRLSSNVPHCVNRPGIDQGMLNFIYYTDRLSFNTSMIRVWPHGDGPVNTIGYVPEDELKLTSDNLLLNNDGELAALVHQYDRKVVLRERFRRDI